MRKRKKNRKSSFIGRRFSLIHADKNPINLRRRSASYYRGSVLIVTIWVVAILVILTVSLTGLTSERILFSKQYRRQTQAYFIARSGITQALAELKRDAKSSGYDGLNETWSNSPEVFQERKVGEGYFNVSHPVNSVGGDPTTYGGEGITGTAETVLLYGLVDEERKINLNSAPPQHLINLFEEQAGLTPSESKSIANCIIDWRDAGDEPREDGAENSFYQSL
ncbi:MAG: general secretion pathway protein GspK, partial [Planctomycetes bacterium]|nr:general secretion pathway protein GspK [Planctomycetota bacterium]